MRIAFVSHEFPPETGGGGIGTYLVQVTAALADAGHEVEVFAGAGAGPPAGASEPRPGVRVHRVDAPPGAAFRAAVLPVFEAVHRVRPFDVLEGTDFDAPGNAIKAAHAELPYVVKLHTPRFVIDELHQRPLSPWQALRLRAGAWRRGQRFLPGPPIRQRPEALAELDALALADELAAPSRAIADAAAGWRPGARAKTTLLPYPFLPDPALLAIPAGGATHRITFLGRLEERKGIFDLASAAAQVVAVLPQARFRFVGRPVPAADGTDPRTALERRAGPAASRLEFTGAVPPAEIPRHLAETDIVVAPSHWESFGLVCCEAMAAARPVIAGSAGGMGEVLDEGRTGFLVAPGHVRALAQAIIALLHDHPLRQRLGEAGRARVLQAYAPARILPRQLASYERAIARCRRP